MIVAPRPDGRFRQILVIVRVLAGALFVRVRLAGFCKHLGHVFNMPQMFVARQDGLLRYFSIPFGLG